MLSRSIIPLQLDQVAAAVADAAGPGGSSAAASSGVIRIFSRGQVLWMFQREFQRVPGSWKVVVC